MPIPPNVITAPDPGPLRYGLFNAATGPLAMPGRARQSGVTYDAVGCGTARGYPAECDVTPPTKVFDENNGEDTVLPFVVYTSINCASAGYTAEYLEDKVRHKLLSTEQTGVEEALWSGSLAGTALANQPTLQGATDLGTATGIAAGIGVLEQHAAEVYGYVPVIHAEARLAAIFGTGGAIRKDVTVLRTPLGSALAFGGGYPGTSPAAVAPVAGHAWIYITGRVTLWRADDVFVPPAGQTLDRSINQYNLIAEREWMAAIDCFSAAVDVTL